MCILGVFFLTNLKEDISKFTSEWRKSFFSSVFSPFKLNIHLVLLTAPQALEVSDHFPVEVDLKPNHRYLLRNEL